MVLQSEDQTPGDGVSSVVTTSTLEEGPPETPFRLLPFVSSVLETRRMSLTKNGAKSPNTSDIQRRKTGTEEVFHRVVTRFKTSQRSLILSPSLV